MVGQKHCRAIIRRVGKPDPSQELKYLVYLTRMPSIQIRKPKGGQKFYTRRWGVVSQYSINEHYSDFKKSWRKKTNLNELEKAYKMFIVR